MGQAYLKTLKSFRPYRKVSLRDENNRMWKLPEEQTPRYPAFLVSMQDRVRKRAAGNGRIAQSVKRMLSRMDSEEKGG